MFDLGKFLHSVLGGVGNVAQGAAHAVQTDVARTPVLNQLFHAINSVNPLYAQPALSPESLRPGQHGNAPYALNGRAQDPSWGIRLPMQHPTVPMPQVQGLPDYTVRPNPSVYAHPYLPPDSSFPQPGAFQPRGQYQNAIPIHQPTNYGA